MNPNTPQPNEQPDVPTPESNAFATNETNPDVNAAAAPTPAQAPLTSTPGTDASAPASGPSQTPKDKKKLIILLASIGGVILLAVIGLLVYLSLTTVSREDYRAAATQFNEVSSANTALNRTVSSLSRSTSSTDQAEFNEAVSEVESAINTIKTENEELGKLKAVRVGQGGELYNTFDKKLDDYIAYANGLVASVKPLNPALAKCDAIGDASGNDARLNAVRDCSTALNQVGELQNPSFNEFITTMKAEYAKFATAFDKAVNGSSDEARTARSEVLDIQRNIRTATTKFSTALRESDDEKSVRDDARALADYLNEQQRS